MMARIDYRMAKDFVESWAARAGGLSSFDNGVAAFAAFSAAFVTFAMPSYLFEGMVAGSGISGIVAAAQPPLGATARAAAIVAAASLTFFAVRALLRAIDDMPAAAAARPVVRASYKPVEVEAETPRFRRADAHPDAPPRRPIFAGREFGEPADATYPDLSGWEKAYEEDVEPLELDTPLAAQEAPSAPEPAAEAPAPDAQQETSESFEYEPAPEAEAEAEPVPVQAEAEAPKAAAPIGENESVGSLMQRLEGGLVRRSSAGSSKAEGKSLPPQQANVGHRLRSALADLQQMSGRN